MSKHIVKGFVTYTKASYADEPTISFSDYKPSPEYWPDTAIVSELSIEVEVPDDFNPMAQLVANLEKQKEEAGREFAEKVAAINLRLSKLQALEFSPAEAQAEEEF